MIKFIPVRLQENFVGVVVVVLFVSELSELSLLADFFEWKFRVAGENFSES